MEQPLAFYVNLFIFQCLSRMFCANEFKLFDTYLMVNSYQHADSYFHYFCNEIFFKTLPRYKNLKVYQFLLSFFHIKKKQKTPSIILTDKYNAISAMSLSVARNYSRQCIVKY